MRSCDLIIETPRGTIKAHTIYTSIDEAQADGWGIWFQHERYLILGRDNRAGAIIDTTPRGENSPSFELVLTDAGRSGSRRPKQKNDCTVRALSLALGITYDQAYDTLVAAGRKCGARFDFNSWIDRQPFARKISFPAVAGQPRMNPVEFSRHHRTGTYIVRVSKHVLVFKDGVAYDDIRIGDSRCVYTAWEIAPGATL